MFRLRPETGSQSPVTLDPSRRYLLGRDPQAELSFPDDASMSRIQAELLWRGGKWVVENRSQHGTFVNDMKVTTGCVLEPGNVLVLGATRLVFEGEAGVSSAAASPGGVAPGAKAPAGAGYDQRGVFHMGYTKLLTKEGVSAGDSAAATVKDASLRRNVLFFGVMLAFAFCGTCCLSLTVLLPALTQFPEKFVIACTVALAPAVPYLALYKLLDRNAQIPLKNFLACFFWGATVGCGFSIIFNSLTGAVVEAAAGAGASNLATSVLAAPFFEESTKGLAVLVVFFILRDEFDNAVEGMLLGAASGLGFALVENCVYDTKFLTTMGMGAFLTMGAFRALTCALMGHPVYTAMTGLGLGLSREQGRSSLRFVFPVLGWVLAMSMHALWNFSAGVVIPAIFGESGLGLIALAVFVGGGCALFFHAVLLFSLMRERRTLLRYLGDEVQAGFIEPDELEGFRSLLGRERFVLEGLGRGTYRLRKELRRAQLELAFRKWHLEQGDAVKGSGVDAELLLARTRIRDARNAINAREGRRRGAAA